MAKAKKRKITAYLSQRSLDALECAGDTAELNYALATFAGLLHHRGCRLAERIAPQEWELLRDVLDEDCWELPHDGTTWLDVVTHAVEDHCAGRRGLTAELEVLHTPEASNLLDILAECDDLDAVAILTAVRYCERLGPCYPASGLAWWEPSARIRRKTVTEQPQLVDEAKNPRRKRK